MVFYDDDYKYESWGKDGIEYLTDVDLQKQLLDIANELRGIRASREFAPLLRLATNIVSRPLADIDNYIA